MSDGERVESVEPAFNVKEWMTRVSGESGESGEKWTLRKAARLMIMIRKMFRAFRANLRPYEHMCETCKKLELHQNKFVISQYSSDRRQQAYTSLLATNQDGSSAISPLGLGSSRYELGTLRSIRERAEDLCPFCKLVIQSLEIPKLFTRQKGKIEKCEKDLEKIREEIDRLRTQIRESEVEIVDLYHEYFKPPTKRKEKYRTVLDIGVEDFTAKVNEHGEAVRQKKSSIQKLENDIKPTEAALARHKRDRATFRRTVFEATCQASFQMDGREVERESSGEVISSRPRTRRIQLRWTHSALEPSYIVLVAPEPGRPYDADQRHLWESDTLFLARSIRTASQNRVLIRSWVELCRDHHGKHCNVDPGEDLRLLTSKAFFGVIDVSEMRLTSLPPHSRYVALSYTWGHQSLYTTRLNNIQLHQEGGGLGKQLKRLPKVIQDAIELVRSMGERYLWVDSLCIVQNNDTSWNLNSSVMDLVYGNAYATICAADGEGAQTGLRGLDGSRVISQTIEECAKGLQLTVSHLAEAYVENSRWNTRGWTFQERLLSRRCIIFAGDRIFFQCRSTALSEDIIGEQGTAGWSIELVRAPLQMLLDIDNKAFAVYADFVRLYSKRNLGKRRDILAAFQGMSNLISRKMGAPLHFGLPTSHFDLALLWSPTKACRRREPFDEKEREIFGDMKFPSWSWCGWSDSAIEYRMEIVEGCLANVNQWLTEHTWIRWYVRDGQGDVRPIWSKERTRARGKGSSMETRWSGYGCHPDSSSDEYGRRLKREYVEDESQPLERSKFRRTLLEYPFGINESKFDSSATQTFPDQPYLQFWTWSAHLRVTPHGSLPAFDLSEARDDVGDERAPRLLRCDIEDYCGDWCGTIVLNSVWLKEWEEKHQEQDSIYEFLAISEAKNFSTTESDLWTYYVPREREQAEWHLYYVLLVTRSPTGIYERQGLGKVFKEAFAKSFLPGREWKEIILG